MKGFYQFAVSFTVAATVTLGFSESAKAAVLTSQSTTTSSLLPGGSSLFSTNPVSGELATKLQATLDQAVAQAGIVGQTVGIISPLGTWFGASRFSNLEKQTPMLPFDLLPIASVTKTFTATTVLQLAEEGKLSLEDTMGKWLPDSIVDNITDGESITIRQLLNGTSGILDVPNKSPSFVQDSSNNLYKIWSPEEVVAYAYGQEREPWDYPNTSFLLAGMIVEKATGETIGDEIQERIIKPLGLNNTFYSAQPPQIPEGTARGYAVLPNGTILDEDGNGIPDDLTNLSPSFFSVFGPAGAIVSNAPDLARFNQALFSGELLETDSFNQMRTFVDTPKDYDFDYGLGLMSREFPTLGKALGHSGDLGVSYHSDMWYFPDTGVTFVGLQNNGRFAGSYDPLLALNTLLKEELQENPKSVPEPGFIAGFIVVGAAGLLLKRKRPILQIQTTVKTKPHPSQETKAA